MSVIIDWIFPKKCYSCQKPGCYICQNCYPKFISKSIKPPQKKLTGHQGTLSLFLFDGNLRKLVTDLKYEFVSEISDDLAELSFYHLYKNYHNLINYWQENKYTLTPVPLHQRRQNWRGFNQSSLIGKNLADLLKISYDDNHFYRQKFRSPQAKITKKENRLTNLGGCFGINSQESLPKNLIFFDDVLTTGSTLDDLSQTLPKTNPYQYWYLTIAG